MSYKDLKGKELSAQVDLFAKPDSRIGEIIYAYSDCLKGETFENANNKIINRLPIWKALLVSYFCLGSWAVYFIGFNVPMLMLAFILLTMLGVAVGRKQPRAMAMGFIGSQGFELFEATGTRENITKHQLVLFPDYTNMSHQITNKYLRNYYRPPVYTNQYTSTDYRFNWYNRLQEKMITSVEGTIYEFYTLGKDYPLGDPDNNKFNFCLKAQEQWANYQWPAYMAQFNKSGSVQFKIGLSATVTLTKQEIILNEKGTDTRIALNDLGAVTTNLEGTEMKLTGIEPSEGWLIKSPVSFSISLIIMADSDLFIRFLNWWRRTSPSMAPKL